MNKFKVGDKVKFVGDYRKHITNYKGKSLENFIKRNRNILCIDSIRSTYINVKEDNFWCFKETELELIKEYTFEDLKKAPIGTKITFEDGVILTKTEEDFYENDVFYRNNENLEALKDNINLGKIIKIEEPEYQTVYESKLEILDEVEKRYLSNVIRPFRGNVRFITKRRYWIDSTEYNDISICIKNNSSIILPKFIANKMYKGMEIEKTYTLEELGL